jgi:Thioredoxin domain
MLSVKICSLRHPERYTLQRLVHAALSELKAEFPALEVDVTELSDPGAIGKYAFVLVLPTLVIDEKVVCSGRFPEKDEVREWLRQAALIDAQKGA